VPKWASTWKELGASLNMKDYLLRNIEKDHPNNCEACCSRMLQEWLDMNSYASWEALFKVLDNFDCFTEAGKKHYSIICTS